MKLRKLDNTHWQIDKEKEMKVPGIVFASEKMLKNIQDDRSLEQLANVACLPGIVKNAIAMPDVHQGYGFSIGGVAAFDISNGIISPGGVGYDINCGCRMMTTGLKLSEVQHKMDGLGMALYSSIPTGVGSHGDIRLTEKEERKVAIEGALWAVKNGFGTEDDLEHTEDEGRIEGADPNKLSERALERGKNQLGTLGSGNHFIEVGYVEKIFEKKSADIFGLQEGEVTVLIHSGSRGFGYQICDDFLHSFTAHSQKLGMVLPDRQLSCARIDSQEGKDYLAAMACGANYAWANRQILMHLVRNTIMNFFPEKTKALQMRLVYDIAHNIAKIETHTIEGKKMKLCVHRKGATRAFPAGHKLVPHAYRTVGHPVIIPGDMGRSSYILTGTERAMTDSFGSCCHGAGRVLSRSAAIKKAKGRRIDQEMEKKGIFVHSHARNTLAEEMPEAYKDIDDVIDVVQSAGLANRVARLKPLVVIKG